MSLFTITNIDEVDLKELDEAINEAKRQDMWLRAKDLMDIRDKVISDRRSKRKKLSS